MLGLCVRRIESNAVPLAFTGVLVVLVALLAATDVRLGLHQFASNRCRFHAIPVAVSVLYHQRPHDYTADRSLAMRFQNTTPELDQQIREAIHQPHDHSGTYFWVADDRGLADYTIAAFQLFGPTTRSLSMFYFLLLGLTLALFVVGFWQSPAALLLPIFALLTWLAIAQVLPYPMPFPSAQGVWAERLPLYESRMFDVLALVSVLHLALLVANSNVNRAAWFTAVPQAAFLVFLYHSRSSIGWQYLALFTLIGGRFGWWAVQRFRSGVIPRTSLARPVFVALLLVGSLIGLKQFQRAVYHPEYLTEHGQRTFWHNALMGLQFHPRLRDELPMPLCDDRCTSDFVLSKMAERDPNLDRERWNSEIAMNSLGNHNRFDWDGYEAVARELYLDQWRSRPDEMAMCYGYYKPVEVALLAGRIAKQLVRVSLAGKAREFVGGLVLVLAAAAGTIVVARRDPRFRGELRALCGVTAVFLPFSLIPGIAFYPAIISVACFYVLGSICGGLAIVLIASHRGGQK